MHHANGDVATEPTLADPFQVCRTSRQDMFHITYSGLARNCLTPPRAASVLKGTLLAGDFHASQLVCCDAMMYSTYDEIDGRCLALHRQLGTSSHECCTYNFTIQFRHCLLD